MLNNNKKLIIGKKVIESVIYWLRIIFSITKAMMLIKCLIAYNVELGKVSLSS